MEVHEELSMIHGSSWRIIYDTWKFNGELSMIHGRSWRIIYDSWKLMENYL